MEVQGRYRGAIRMTPHQVLALLTQDETADLMAACCTYLSPERIATILKEGLEPEEIRQLRAILVDIESDED